MKHSEIRSTRIPDPPVPTGDYDERYQRSFHHLRPAIRYGKLSFEVFAKANRIQVEVTDEQPVEVEVKKLLGGEGESENARQSVSKGREKSTSRDAKKVRGQKGKASVLREGKQARPRKDAAGKGQKRVQKTKLNKKAQAHQKVTKRG